VGDQVEDLCYETLLDGCFLCQRVSGCDIDMGWWGDGIVYQLCIEFCQARLTVVVEDEDCVYHVS